MIKSIKKQAADAAASAAVAAASAAVDWHDSEIDTALHRPEAPFKV
jgi:hypothetical protein